MDDEHSLFVFLLEYVRGGESTRMQGLLITEVGSEIWIQNNKISLFLLSLDAAELGRTKLLSLSLSQLLCFSLRSATYSLAARR